ncbi:MAG TPA: divalent-cation tolerance protein CutA [Terriglobales bacterium]|nr:divalent-cation tolerance protein CutA [Terriglobales bacterium]
MTEKATGKKIILTTSGTKEEAEDIAWVLVERKLAACVNIVALTSIFRWKDEIESSPEFLLIIKTTAAAFERVREVIKELNSYELPECIQLSIEAGSETYLKWIADSVE